MDMLQKKTHFVFQYDPSVPDNFDLPPVVQKIESYLAYFLLEELKK